MSASPDLPLLFATRALRMFAYGVASVVLVLHLAAAGIGEARVGLLLTLTLLGDVAVSLAVTTRADRLGRRRMLALGGALVAATGAAFATHDRVPAPRRSRRPSASSPRRATRSARSSRSSRRRSRRRSRRSGAPRRSPGTSSPARSRPRPARSRAASGAEALQRAGVAPLAELPAAVRGVRRRRASRSRSSPPRLSRAVEAPRAPSVAPPSALGLHRSRGVVLRLSALFSLDAFAGGFVVQSFVAWWFHRRFGAGPALLGGIFFGANVLAGVSALSAAAIARRFGLVEHDGLHPPALEPAPRGGAARPDAARSRSPSCSALLHLPDGRADAAVLHDGGRRSRTSARPPPASPASRARWARRSRRSPPGRSTRAPRSRACRSSSRGGSKVLYDLALWRGFRHLPAEGERAGRAAAPLEARGAAGILVRRVKRTSRPLTVVALLLGLFLAAMEMTVVSTAMPTVVAELGGLPLYAWAFAAYMLATTVTVPIWGKLADLRGRKPDPARRASRSSSRARSPAARRGSMAALIAWRAVQGLGAGAMQPVTFTIVGDLFDVHERGRMQGLFGAVWGLAGLVGPARRRRDRPHASAGAGSSG